MKSPKAIVQISTREEKNMPLQANKPLIRLKVSDRDLLKHLLDHVPEYVYFKDMNSRFIRVSKSLVKSFGYEDPSIAVGKTDFDFFSAEHARQAYEGEQEIIRTGRTLSIEEKETRHDQPDAWVLTTKMPMYNSEGTIIGTFGISRDITERKLAEESLRSQAHRLQNQIEEINQLHEQLKDQATHDTLTGLFNRRVMDQVLAQRLMDCKDMNLTFCILIIDIDEFKSINDQFGHQIGDAILEQFGKTILTSTRTDDFSCRLGGDEILMAFQKMSVVEALHKAESIRQKLSDVSVKDGENWVSATVSIGIAVYPQHGNTVNELISKADEALYTAKQKGRNKVALAAIPDE